MDENLDTYIRKDYCKDCLKLTWDLEKNTRKVDNYRNHLRFSFRCLHSDYTPRSLKLTSNVKGSRAERIIHDTERKLLNERIKQTNSIIKNLNSKNRIFWGKSLINYPAKHTKGLPSSQSIRSLDNTIFPKFAKFPNWTDLNLNLEPIKTPICVIRMV